MEKIELEELVIAIIGIIGVLLIILAFGDFYGGEWQATAQNIAPLTVAIVAFAMVIAGVGYWRKR